MTTPEPSIRTTARQVRGALARRSGRRAEAWAALWLMAKGYRILGFRLRTRLGEIDSLAQKRRVLAVVEVKSRTTLEAALAAVAPELRDRLPLAGQASAGARPRRQDPVRRLHLIALAPGRLPLHRPHARNGA